MPKRNKVEQLPEKVREEIKALLRNNGFSQYTFIADKLRSEGYDVSAKSVNRFGAKYQKQYEEAIEAAEAARKFTQDDVDGTASRNSAIIGLLQSALLASIKKLEEIAEEGDPEKFIRAVSELSKTSSNLARASMSVTQYNADIKARIDKVFQELADTNRISITEEEAKAIKLGLYGIFEETTTKKQTKS